MELIGQPQSSMIIFASTTANRSAAAANDEFETIQMFEEILFNICEVAVGTPHTYYNSTDASGADSDMANRERIVRYMVRILIDRLLKRFLPALNTEDPNQPREGGKSTSLADRFRIFTAMSQSLFKTMPKANCSFTALLSALFLPAIQRFRGRNVIESCYIQ